MAYWDEKHSEEKDPFERECMNVGHRITSKGAMMILCCIDGSQQSDIAFRSGLNLRRKFDFIDAFHAYKADDSNLQPPNWRHNQLYSKYEIELIGHVPTSLYTLSWVDREGESVNTILHKAVDPEYFMKNALEPSPLPGPPDLIIMGQHGRKGPKDTVSEIGTTADQALRNLHYPALIVKALVPPGPRTFIMAVNESSASKRGFDILMRFLNPRDSLLLVHFTHPLKLDPTLTHSKNQIKEYFEKELLDVAPPNSRFEFVEYSMGVPPADAIVDYVNSAPCDVFAIAPRASRDRSSVTESVVNNIKVSVLLCKN